MNRLSLVKNTAQVKCCRGAKILMSLSDGVLVGSCSRCDKNVVRLNPRTGKQEWLHGESPWTEQNAAGGPLMPHRQRIPRIRSKPRVVHGERSNPVDGHVRERLKMFSAAWKKRRAEIFERAGGRCEGIFKVTAFRNANSDFIWIRCLNRATEWSHNRHGANKCDCLECGIASCTDCHRRRHQPKACPKKDAGSQRNFTRVTA